MATPDASFVRVEKRGGAPAAASTSSSTAADAIRFRVSSEDEDFFGDVVVQAGLEFPDSLPAVADHSHKLDSTIGDWQAVERGHRETFATLRLLPRGASRMADLVRAMHAGGYPLASSVYFDIARADIEPITKSQAGGRPVKTGNRYLRGKVREITLTQFPANPAAVAVARSQGFTDAELAALSRTEHASTTPVARTLSAVAGAPASKGLAMTLAEMISAAQAAHETALASLGTATLALEADSGDANLQAVQRATSEVDSLFARLNVLRGAESSAARRAAGTAAPQAGAPTPVARAVAEVGSPAIIRRTRDVVVPAGTRLAQLAIARKAAFETKRPLDQVAQEMFGHEPEVLAIARTAVGAADSTTAGWAAELVRSETRTMLQEDLVPISVWANLASQGTSLNFNGANSVLIPTLNVGMTADGAWVGEGGVIPVVKGAVGSKRLSRFKLGGIVPMTKELQRVSDPAAVEVMRRFLMRVISNLLDKSMIDSGAEVTGIRPAGILNGVVTTAGAAGGGIAAVQTDIKTLVGKFITANVGTKPVLLMNSATKLSLGLMTNGLGEFVFRDEVGGGRLLAVPIIASPFVTAGTVILVDADCFASAIDDMEIDVTETATLTMANADAVAPTQAGASAGGGALGTINQVVPDGGIPVSGGTGASVAGSTALSLWQTWSLGIRLVMPASFGMVKAGAVQGLTGVTW